MSEGFNDISSTEGKDKKKKWKLHYVAKGVHFPLSLADLPDEFREIKKRLETESEDDIANALKSLSRFLKAILVVDDLHYSRTPLLAAIGEIEASRVCAYRAYFSEGCPVITVDSEFDLELIDEMSLEELERWEHVNGHFIHESVSISLDIEIDEERDDDKYPSCIEPSDAFLE